MGLPVDAVLAVRRKVECPDGRLSEEKRLGGEDLNDGFCSLNLVWKATSIVNE